MKSRELGLEAVFSAPVVGQADTTRSGVIERMFPKRPTIKKPLCPRCTLKVAQPRLTPFKKSLKSSTLGFDAKTHEQGYKTITNTSHGELLLYSAHSICQKDSALKSGSPKCKYNVYFVEEEDTTETFSFTNNNFINCSPAGRR